MRANNQTNGKNNLSAVVDAAPLLPSFLRTDISHQLRAFYIDTYHDKFFEDPAPAWFSAFIVMEMVYHAPLSLWAIRALLRGTMSNILA